MKHLYLLTALAVLLPCLAGAETMYVQVSKTRLLEKPSAFSKSKTQLTYLTQVEVLGKQGAYYQVNVQNGKGYLPISSLSLKPQHYTGMLSKQYVSSDEVAVATKGFNAQVESDYRAKNPTLAYDALDKLITQTTYPDPSARFKAFRKAGSLGEFSQGGEK